MTRRILGTSFISLILLLTSLSAVDNELKKDMNILNQELREVQQGFMFSDKDGVEHSVNKFAKHVKEFLGNKEKIAKMLPSDKKHKANEAVMSAQIIEHNVQIIRDAISNKYKRSDIIRREESQRAYTYIEHACFRCHNIVRDLK